jgi:5,10-methylenetetrahydromethanopterin reductase
VVSFGVDLHPIVDARTLLDEAQLADRLGYDIVWVADSQLIWREAFSPGRYCRDNVTGPTGDWGDEFGAASRRGFSQRLRYIARAVGFMQLGIGVRDSALRTMKMQPATLSELAAAVETIRTLCNGGAVVRLQSASSKFAAGSRRGRFNRDSAICSGEHGAQPHDRGVRRRRDPRAFH